MYIAEICNGFEILFSILTALCIVLLFTFLTKEDKDAEDRKICSWLFIFSIIFPIIVIIIPSKDVFLK